MKAGAFTLVALLSLAWGAPASAQTAVDLEIAPFVGGTFYLNGLPEHFTLRRGREEPLLIEGGRHEDALTLGVSSGLRFDESLALEVMFSWLPTQLSARQGLNGDVSAQAYMYALSLAYHPGLPWWIEPFFGVGIGGETYDYALQGAETHTEWMGNVFGGVYLPMTRATAARLEVRDCVTWFDPHLDTVEGRTQNDLMVTLGLAFRVPLSDR